MKLSSSILLLCVSAGLAVTFDGGLALAADAPAAKPALMGKRDSDAPINIAADKFVADENAKTGTWSGNVVIVQGDMRMRANTVRMNVVGKDNKPDKIFAQGNVVENVMTRTVRDSAAMLDVTGQPEPASPYAHPPKERPYMEEIERAPGRLRIAWSSETPNGRPIQPEIQAALESTATLLEKLGHELVPQGLGIDYRALYAAQMHHAGANFAAGMRRFIDIIGREPEEDELERLTWANLRGARKVTGEEALYSLQQRRMLSRGVLALFESYDVYLTPVLGTTPAPIGYIDPVAVPGREISRRNGELFPFPAAFNFTGQPSMSLPLHMSASGLPIGMMFTARYADEATLFRLAAQLEKECPWKDRRPAVWN